MTEITAWLSTALADRYAIERELGVGGMATVYLAHDLKHDPTAFTLFHERDQCCHHQFAVFSRP